MEKTIQIQALSLTDRPREKLLAKGSAALSNAELLAVLLGSGTHDTPILSLCNQLTESVGDDMSILATLTPEDLCRIKGIGPAKAMLIIAALELGDRRKTHETGVKVIKEETQVTELTRDYFLNARGPLFLLVLLNPRQELLATAELPTAGNAPPELSTMLKLILDAGAAGFWLARNRLEKESEVLKTELLWVKNIVAAAKMMNLNWYGQVLVHSG